MSRYIYRQENEAISMRQLETAMWEELEQFGRLKNVLIIPPDISRLSSYAGPVVCKLFEMLTGVTVDIMPALGTHIPMGREEISCMYPGVPHDCFSVHDWRKDVVKIGEVARELVFELSNGMIDEPIDIEINKRLLDRSYDAVISVGQVVPHEVAGMASHSKNLFVGCGGFSMLNKTHYLGALYGMERIMGRDHSPVREIFDYAERFLDIPLLYVLTVTTDTAERKTQLEGTFIGRGRDGFEKAVELSLEKNVFFLDEELDRVVCYLDPQKIKTTWIGNKAIYRTRMAIADGGELVVIGPGVFRFGEDLNNDRLIRKYGYRGRDKILDALKSED
ncbi:MAG: lactate racemase domain-containing protein [Synergistaceae bacterium]|jgi:nickel-dependent lactate racemase|nr:lactate racemase domain-containing protein [Synergistaceae bacterium]